ncbi:MAG: LON peptidase substrate-binding domain-containing protein [Ignavibacteriae bacterium]|nr:LON peptidase substrate-binding domain-containing protein [Ignavibacteriota bacterium]
MSEIVLPLFPLQVVMFPTAVLPLHIFEERYRQLISDCENGDKEFGISLAQDENVAKVGCSVVVTNIVHRYEDGKLDILVRGQRRYQLENFVESSRLYTEGRVRFLSDEDEPVDAALAEETVRLHNELIQLAYRDKQFEVEYNSSNPILSFRIAQKAGLDLAQRQALLEEDSENKRLTALREYLAEIIPKLQQLSEVERVIKSDGYII